MTEQNAFRCGLQKAAAKTGIHLTWHQLRHWSGTMLYRAGVKINVIQARLGHSRWQTTADWYIENHAEGERTAADVASKLLDGWERKEEVKEDVSVPKCCRNVAVRLDREEPSL